MRTPLIKRSIAENGYPLVDADKLDDFLASGELVLFCTEDRKRFRERNDAATTSNESQAGQLSSASAPPNAAPISRRELLRGVFRGGKGQSTSRNDPRPPSDTGDV